MLKSVRSGFLLAAGLAIAGGASAPAYTAPAFTSIYTSRTALLPIQPLLSSLEVSSSANTLFFRKDSRLIGDN